MEMNETQLEKDSTGGKPTWPGEPQQVSGFGGWLILPQIGFVITLITMVLFVLNDVPGVLDPELWELINTEGSSLDHPLIGPTLIIELVWNLGLLAAIIVTIILFYMRKKIVPKLMVALYIVSLAGLILDYVLLLQIPVLKEMMIDGSQVREIVREVIMCAIWIPYFLVSKRVKNTFVK
ncbi:DUF2569 domain-containing protein [Paenibacillus sambharensis]|nr:DUF2569 domain-containing protein [Paenibacillus sambharensis]